MAGTGGILAFLFGGNKRPPDPNPLPGVGGYALPPGPYGATGKPGSTTAAPRNTPQTFNAGKLPDRRNGPPLRGVYNQQEAVRPDQKQFPNPRRITSPRATPRLTTPRSGIVTALQENSPAEFFGGFFLRTVLGLNDVTGGELTRRAAAQAKLPEIDPRDTTTLWKDAQPTIGVGTPGSNNVRNQIAQRYKARPGQGHTYKSAPRADQALEARRRNDGGAGLGPITQEVTVDNRFVAFGGGNQTWSVQRQMPYRGGTAMNPHGWRGGYNDGTRYYAVGPNPSVGQIQGAYGERRLRQQRVKPPVAFVQPGPWSADFYLQPAEAAAGAGPVPAPSRRRLDAAARRLPRP